MGIVLKSADEIAKMRATGRIVRAVLDAIEAACVPGVSTAELNRIAERAIERAGARSAFLGYRPRGPRRIRRSSAPRETTSWSTASRARTNC